MAKQKIRAGHYTVATKHGRFFIRNVGTRAWIVTDTSHRRIGKFPTLSEAQGFLSGLTVAPASDKSKRYLRFLLDQQAGNELAEAIRAHFNNKRNGNLMITQPEVSRAIDQLTGKHPSRFLPSQRTTEPVMPRREAIAMARAAITKPAAV